MKKFLSALVFILPLAAFAVDDFGMNIPQWKDFAPSAFINVKEPKGLGKLNVTAKYWYERRVSFERSLAECKDYESHEERFSCYEELKINQFRQNTDYNARIDARMQKSSNVQGMTDMTNTMMPLNNYINSFTPYLPSEFR